GRILAAATGRYAFTHTPSSIELWDVEHHKLLGELKGHQGAVMAVAYSPDSRLVASCSTDGTAKLGDVATRQPLATFPTAKENGVSAVAFSGDGRTLAVSGDSMDRVDLWDVSSRSKVGSIPATEGTGTSCSTFSPNGKILAFGDTAGIHIVERATLK